MLLDQHEAEANAGQGRSAELDLPPAEKEKAAEEKAIMASPQVEQRTGREHREPDRPDAARPPRLGRPDEEARPRDLPDDQRQRIGEIGEPDRDRKCDRRIREAVLADRAEPP